MTTIAPPTPPPGFIEDLADKAFSPGWAKREPQMWATPKSKYVPMVWRYADALAQLTRAADFVSPEFAERRNLILVNPIEGNIYPSCRHLVVAYQLVLPGETARSHRHSPNALRLVMDASEGMYTLVNGVRVDMAPGDVVLTPQWHWHGHANYSDAPAFWIDFLDVPLVQNMENMFFEHHPDTLEAVQLIDPNSSFRYKGTAIEEQLREACEIDLGDDQLPTISLTAMACAQGDIKNYPADTDNVVFAATSGEVVVTVAPLGAVTMTRGDVIVVPSWNAYSVSGGAGGGAILRVSDEPVFRKLGFRKLGLEA